MGAPRTSIVVLCYNALEEATRPCVESVLRNTAPGSYELVLVDNASADGTPEYLRSLAAAHRHVQIQLNETNRGYAGGNNDGLRLAQGEFVVLLNNDTLVPPGWLPRLLALLETHPEIGLVGPITNSAGNEQCVHLPGLTEAGYETVAGDYIARQEGFWFTTTKLGFFCVALRRALVDRIGLLDEQFGIGMFEDDDYCMRARAAGLDLAVAESCFVYHKGSVSFKKLESANYLELFNRNRTYFFEKHRQLWLYTDIAEALWQRIRADIALAADPAERARALERCAVRTPNMSGALHQLHTVEERGVQLGGVSYQEQALADKHRQLMEISDWATELNRQLGQLRSSSWYRLHRLLRRGKE